MNKMKSLMNERSAELNIYTELPHFLGRDRHLLLATVAATIGSAPQKIGNSAVFGKEGLIGGTIGGGIVEYSIQKDAKDAIQTRRSALHPFSLSNEISDNQGAICGGSMEILLDAEPYNHIEIFNAIRNSLSKREHGVLVTYARPQSGGGLHIERDWITGSSFHNKAAALIPDIETQVKEMLASPVEGDFRRTDMAKTAEKEKQFILLQAIMPSPRLIIAGAGHVGKALSHLGKLLGFEVMVWDYRSDYATKKNLPDADIILSGDINNTLAEVTADRNTYIISVTTDHKHDIEVLKLFMNSPAAYLGMIASRKKTVLMREQFLSEGWATEEQWEKIYAPVGLNINSETVEEIAVSIAAQLVQVRHQLNKKQ
ncbi:MAG: XdhC family protein [Mariniphaga sp.]